MKDSKISDIFSTSSETRNGRICLDVSNSSNDLNDLNPFSGPNDSKGVYSGFNDSNVSNDLNHTIDGRRWYVIYTKPHSENEAQEQLERKRIPVFLPKIRQVKFRKHKLQERIQPLFPSYIFARFTIPEDYYDVKWARGVKRIVGSGDMPIPLDDSIVILLREQVNEKGLIQPRPKFKNGDKVRVKQGPLEGLWGIIHNEVDPKGRVRVLMDILHSGAKVELPYSYVERYD